MMTRKVCIFFKNEPIMRNVMLLLFVFVCFLAVYKVMGKIISGDVKAVACKYFATNTTCICDIVNIRFFLFLFVACIS